MSLTAHRAMLARGLLVVGLVILTAVAVLVLADYGDDDPYPDPERPIATSVDAIVDVAPRWFRQAVTVTATAVPLDNGMVVLEGGRRAITLDPEPGSVRGEIETGEKVTVTGVVRDLDRLQVAELRRLLHTDPPDALTRAPTALGEVFISGETIDATA